MNSMANTPYGKGDAFLHFYLLELKIPFQVGVLMFRAESRFIKTIPQSNTVQGL